MDVHENHLAACAASKALQAYAMIELLGDLMALFSREDEGRRWAVAGQRTPEAVLFEAYLLEGRPLEEAYDDPPFFRVEALRCGCAYIRFHDAEERGVEAQAALLGETLFQRVTDLVAAYQLLIADEIIAEKSSAQLAKAGPPPLRLDPLLQVLQQVSRGSEGAHTGLRPRRRGARPGRRRGGLN